MSEFHFKQAGVFHLQRLQHLIRDKTGRRFKLTNQQSLRQLITEAIATNDPHAREEFSLFFENCWPCTQRYIKDEVLRDYPKLREGVTF